MGNDQVWYDPPFTKVYATADGDEEIRCAFCHRPIAGKAFSLGRDGTALHNECERQMINLSLSWSYRPPKEPASGLWRFMRFRRRQLLRMLLHGELYVEATATLSELSAGTYSDVLPADTPPHRYTWPVQGDQNT